MRCTLAKKAATTGLEAGAESLRKVAPSLAAEDMEAIHAARVASRRLRAALAAHEGVIRKSEHKKLEKALRRITSGLGTARELDVTIQLLEHKRPLLSGAERYASTHTLTQLRALRDQQKASIAETAAYLNGPAFWKRLNDAASATRKPKVCYLDEARIELKRLRRNLWRAHRQWQDAQTEESLHQVRIAFKKFRYGCEQYAGLYGKRMRNFIRELRTVQDDLGIWNDFRVASDYVTALADGAEPMAASGIEPLAALLNDEAEEHLTTYKGLAEAFFSTQRRDDMKQTIAGVKAACCDKRRKD